MPSKTDFFRSETGHFHGQWRLKGRIKDILFDARLRWEWMGLLAGGRMNEAPARNILIAAVEVPSRKADLKQVMQKLSRTRHKVTTIYAPCSTGKGKFQNINDGLRDVDLSPFDWMILVDDDIAFDEGFLDRFIYLAEATSLQVCMPAHKFRSNQTFNLTVRHWASLVRFTCFVESGPVTAFRKPMFPHVFPFPELKWAWGTDIAWSETARELGLSIGIVDGTPVRHLRPVGGSYDVRLATDEAEAFLAARNISRSRDDILQTVKTMSGADVLSAARRRQDILTA
ncbi:MAG TPA: hypothetical protein VGG85_16935 [Terracidiphilus sp.]